MKEFNKQIIIALTSGVIFLIMASMAEAKSGGIFTIYPTYKHQNQNSWLILEKNPGQTIQDSVTIENLTDETINLDLFVKEATKNEDFIIIENEEFQNLGSWITLEKAAYELSPHQKKQIPVSINIPKDAKPQEYTGAIFASYSKINEQEIKITSRIGVRVYLTVTQDPFQNSDLDANIFNTNPAAAMIFMVLSLVGFSGSIFLNLITVNESNKK
jgi:uncharacterized membrane protein